MDELTIEDYEYAFEDHKRLVRELDVALNGVKGASPQASLCDIVCQVKAWNTRKSTQLHPKDTKSDKPSDIKGDELSEAVAVLKSNMGYAFLTEATQKANKEAFETITQAAQGNTQLKKRVECLEMEMDRKGYVAQDIAMECLDMLEPWNVKGEANTLWALTRKVTGILAKLETVCPNPDKQKVCAKTDKPQEGE